MSTCRGGGGWRAGLLIALCLASAGCGVRLVKARLEPAAVAAGDVRVTVTELATTGDLYGGGDDERLSPDAEVVARVRVDNATAARLQVAVDRWRLVMTGTGGQAVTGSPVRLSAQEVKYTRGETGSVGPLSLAAGQGTTLFVAFRGLGGLPTDGPLAMRLDTGGATPPLVLAAPAAESPRWEREGAFPHAIGMRVGSWTGPGFRMLDTFAPQLFFSRGRFLIGYGMAAPAIIVQEVEGESRIGALGFSPRAGWHPFTWPFGVVAGPDFWFVTGEDGPASDWMASATLTARMAVGPRRRFSPVPLASRRHALRSAWFNLSYVRWFGRGILPSGNGTMVSFCFGLMGD